MLGLSSVLQAARRASSAGLARPTTHFRGLGEACLAVIWILHWISSPRLPAPPRAARGPKGASVEPVLSEYELGRRAKLKRNNKFLVSVGLLFPR